MFFLRKEVICMPSSHNQYKIRRGVNNYYNSNARTQCKTKTTSAFGQFNKTETVEMEAGNPTGL